MKKFTLSLVVLTVMVIGCGSLNQPIFPEPTATQLPSATSAPPVTTVPTATAIPSTATTVSCAAQLKEVFFGDHPSKILGVVASANFADANLYNTSEVLFVPASDCSTSGAAIYFNDWSSGQAAFTQDVVLQLNPEKTYNLQKYTLPNGKLYSDHGQKLVFGPGCVVLWQNDDAAPGGVSSGWRVAIGNGAQCEASARAPTAVAAPQTQPKQQQAACDGGQPLLVDFSADPRGVASKIERLGNDTRNLYNVSRVRLFPNPNPGGCTAPAKINFQKWCDDSGNCSGNNGKPWLETNLDIKVNKDYNLQKVFFPGMFVDINDKAQKMWLWPGQCVVLDENDSDLNGYEVTFCSQNDP